MIRTLTASELEDRFHVGHARLQQILNKTGLKPIAEQKFGRGYLRLYDEAQVNAVSPNIQELLSAMNGSGPRRSSKDNAKSLKPVASYVELYRKVERIEMIVLRLLDLWESKEPNQ